MGALDALIGLLVEHVRVGAPEIQGQTAIERGRDPGLHALALHLIDVLKALRAELDQEYEAQTGLAKQASKDKPRTELSSRSRT